MFIFKANTVTKPLIYEKCLAQSSNPAALYVSYLLCVCLIANDLGAYNLKARKTSLMTLPTLNHTLRYTNRAPTLRVCIYE